MNQEELWKQLITTLQAEKTSEDLAERGEKLQRILLLLAGGTALATCLIAPGTARLFRGFFRDDSDWREWKMFNEKYLSNTIRKLEKQKVIEIETEGKIGRVKLTEKGRSKVLEMGLESLTISKPARWDGKWRFVFYDVLDRQDTQRKRLRDYLKAGGFYQFQESVYLHAYPCEKEVEFLRQFLGLGGQVRLVTADRIENDQQFRDFFGV